MPHRPLSLGQCASQQSPQHSPRPTSYSVPHTLGTDIACAKRQTKTVRRCIMRNGEQNGSSESNQYNSHCPKCGAEVPKGETTCRSCGERLDDPVQPSQEPSASPSRPPESSPQPPHEVHSRELLIVAGVVLLLVGILLSYLGLFIPYLFGGLLVFFGGLVSLVIAILVLTQGLRTPTPAS